jgi:hypothetical protein
MLSSRRGWETLRYRFGKLIRCASFRPGVLAVGYARQATVVPFRRVDHASAIPACRSCSFVGIIEAPDENSALKAAIEEFGIINPEHQNRLFVRRVPGDDE